MPPSLQKLNIQHLLAIRALKDIEAGEEICINYGYDYGELIYTKYTKPAAQEKLTSIKPSFDDAITSFIQKNRKRGCYNF